MKNKLQIIAAFLCGAFLFSAAGVYAGSELIAKPASFKIEVNGVEQKLSNPPVVINNSTYLPVRAVGEITGYDVNFNNGVVSLTNKKDTSPVVNNETKSETGSNSKYTFGTLPMTQTKNDVTITVHSMTLYDTHTEFEVTVTNNSTWNRNVSFRSGFVYNYNLTDEEMKQAGTVDEGVFKNEIKVGETVTGTLKKGPVPKDVSNVILRGALGAKEAIEFPILLK